MVRSVALMLALLSGAAFAQQQDLSKVEVKVHKLSGNVHYLQGAGGNIGISAGPDGILLIDDQFAPLAEKIEKAIAPLSNKPLRFLLNTHWHGDHTGGNEHFATRGIPILAHSNVRKRMETGGKRPDRVIPASPPVALPVITYEDGISIYFNGEEIRVLHVPRGHTDGDSVVFFTKSKVVHMGDQLFSESFPFIDVDSGGTVKGYIANLERVRGMISPDMKIIAGHGKPISLKEYDEVLAMLKETSARVEKGVAQGKSPAQLTQEGVLKGYERWASAFMPVDRYVGVLHRGFASK